MRGIAIRQLIQLPHAADWYLPMTLRAAGRSRFDVVLALVPAKRLTGGSGSLRFVRDSWVTLVTTDGTRLFSYSKNLDELQANGPPDSRRHPATDAEPHHRKFPGARPVDGVYSTQVGYARSDGAATLCGRKRTG